MQNAGYDLIVGMDFAKAEMLVLSQGGQTVFSTVKQLKADLKPAKSAAIWLSMKSYDGQLFGSYVTVPKTYITAALKIAPKNAVVHYKKVPSEPGSDGFLVLIDQVS